MDINVISHVYASITLSEKIYLEYSKLTGSTKRCERVTSPEFQKRHGACPSHIPDVELRSAKLRLHVRVRVRGVTVPSRGRVRAWPQNLNFTESTAAAAARRRRPGPGAAPQCQPGQPEPAESYPSLRPTRPSASAGAGLSRPDHVVSPLKANCCRWGRAWQLKCRVVTGGAKQSACVWPFLLETFGERTKSRPFQRSF